MEGQTVQNTHAFHQMMQQLLTDGKLNVVRGDDGTNTVAIPRDLLPPDIQAVLPRDGEAPFKQYVDGPTGRIVHDTRECGVRAELECPDPPLLAKDGTAVDRINVVELSQGKNGYEPRIQTFAESTRLSGGIGQLREVLARTFLDCSILSAWDALSTPMKSTDQHEHTASDRERTFEWLALSVDDYGKTHKRMCELRLKIQDGCALDGAGPLGIGLRNRNGIGFADVMIALQALHKGAREEFLKFVEKWHCYSHTGEISGHLVEALSLIHI